MLPRPLRLTRAEVAAVLKSGRRLGDRELSLRALRQPGTSRLAIIVPAKEVRTAVARHRLKRRLRAIIRQTAIKPDYYLAIFAGKTASSWPYPDLKNALTKLLNDL